MRMTVARRRIVMLAIVATICGCQSVRPAPTATDDVSTLRKQRKAEVAESFESKRTYAQLESARSRLQLGDVTGCAGAVQSVLERDPDNADALARMYELKTASGPSTESTAVAQTSFVETQADASEPENRQIATSAAVLALRYNQPELALDLAQSALPRFNDDATLHRIIGLAHYRRGDFGSSQLALQQALSLDNGHPLTYFLLGHTMKKLGDTDAAEWCFVQARRANPTEAAP